MTKCMWEHPWYAISMPVCVDLIALIWVDLGVCRVATSSVLHRQGKISPATPRNQNNDQTSTGQQQEEVQT